ncbi:MAG: ABC transporter ATP-binding protein [Candidatus Xenobia bacterium]|jgi:putative ABC transport system ATP-binding protein
MALLEVKNVSKVYQMGEVQVPALQDADLEVREGEFLVILGPSGSGKSTLLNLLGGMDRPSGGSIRFQDQDLTRASDSQLTSFRRHNVGFVFQFFNLVPTLTALENVQVATQIARDPMDPLQALRMVGLDKRAEHFPSQLSGGEQQRVAIARALASNPRLLLCDEPTGNLDSTTGRAVLRLLWDVNRKLNMTVIIITHSQPVARMGHRAASLRDGRIVSLTENAVPIPPEEIEW